MCFGGASHFDLYLRWPPRPTLLSGYGHLDFSKQPEWGADEWRDYARYLEEQGQSLAKDLIKTRNELWSTQRKLKQSKKSIVLRHGTLLTGYEDPPKKGPGRPRGSTRRSKYVDDAARAIEIKNNQLAAGFKITDNDAAKKALIETGCAEWRANQLLKQVTRQMTELRKQNGANRKRTTNH